MHRSDDQRPGFLGWTAFFFIAECAAGAPSRGVAGVHPQAERVFVVMIMGVLSWLFRMATRTRSAVCPRCGEGTDSLSRVCRSCRRAR